MSKNGKILDKKKIIAEVLGRRDLSEGQEKAIEDIILGYSVLINDSTPIRPTKRDIDVLSEIIRNSLALTLRVVDVYIKPRESRTSPGVPAGRS